MGHRECLGDRVKCWMGKSLKTEIENEENPKNWIPTRSANFGEIQNSKTELGESPWISIKKKWSSVSLKKKPKKINSCIINMLKLWYSGKLVGWCFPITWPSKLFLSSFVGSFPSLLNYPVLNCIHSISLCWFLTTCLTAHTVSGFFFSFIIFFIWKSD